MPPMANAVGGRTARACDSCVRRRARWYCAADDAFLCQPCDSTVHSANTLAGRHHRLRINISSNLTPAPSWHHGFTRKPRTPRPPKALLLPKNTTPLVPNLDDNIPEDDQLLYQVPVFDPFADDYAPPHILVDKKATAAVPGIYQSPGVDLDEFDADVESLLGTGFEDEEFCIEGALGLVETREDYGGGGVKLEPEGVGAVLGCNVDMVKMEFEKETLDIDFDYESPEMATVEEAEGRTLTLKLDYDGVIAAWEGCGYSPWMDGRRPEVRMENCWPYTGIMWGGGEAAAMYGEAGHTVAGDVGREARVSRYREKRRTRLFSKKIRYEVRKLNAEKRPRMKGRFVKRSSFPPASGGAGAGFPY